MPGEAAEAAQRDDAGEDSQRDRVHRSERQGGNLKQQYPAGRPGEQPAAAGVERARRREDRAHKPDERQVLTQYRNRAPSAEPDTQRHPGNRDSKQGNRGHQGEKQGNKTGHEWSPI